MNDILFAIAISVICVGVVYSDYGFKLFMVLIMTMMCMDLHAIKKEVVKQVPAIVQEYHQVNEFKHDSDINILISEDIKK